MRCVTGKTRYDTRKAARDALNALKLRRRNRLGKNKGTVEHSMYACPFCDGFHLTSSPQGRKKGKR